MYGCFALIVVYLEVQEGLYNTKRQNIFKTLKKYSY